MNPKIIFAIRCVLAAVWLYNGLWLKVIALDPHHLSIVTPIGHSLQISPETMLRSIGGLETLLGIGILSGLFYKFVSYFQIAIVLLMNFIGIIFGGGAIQHPLGLIVSNLPTLMCAWLVAAYGPGSYSLRLPNAK
jgi:uncharacterized membrane protein YphA (DoxX/SURF4 family)